MTCSLWINMGKFLRLHFIHWFAFCSWPSHCFSFCLSLFCKKIHNMKVDKVQVSSLVLLFLSWKNLSLTSWVKCQFGATLWGPFPFYMAYPNTMMLIGFFGQMQIECWIYISLISENRNYILLLPLFKICDPCKTIFYENNTYVKAFIYFVSLLPGKF